jgi:predicted ATPase/DNA-binding SARP family transcriptional activator
MRVGLLGPLEVHEGDHRIPIGSPRQRAALALLALDAGRVVSADRLIDGLWGDDAPAGAPNALQHQISRLRKTVGRSLVTRGSGYLLDVEQDDVDALRFARLTREGRAALRARNMSTAAATLRDALALWRGAPLEEFGDRDWARQEAARLQELYLAAVEDRIDADLSDGLHADVLEELRSMVGEHPFRERLWGQLMVALYRSGRQPDALAAYAEARRVLADEHGLDPGPQLAQLEQAILTQDPDLAAPVRPEPALAQHRGGNLPAPLTAFIGRHEQVPVIRKLLRAGRLVTLTGPPGVGKTRLAIEVGREMAQDFPDGAWLVELAALAAADAIPDMLAALFGLRRADRAMGPEDAASAPLSGLVDQLGRRRLLLILDNCEHLVAGVAAVLAPLLAGCADLRVLATSREVLGVPGETQWPVPALSLPAPQLADPRELAGSEAVRLFEDRAIRVRPSFALTAETAPSVAEVCRRLDGLPLAIELAAARVNVLPVAHIARALDDRFQLLVAGGRTVPERQQTLRAAVGWSYDLLHEDERAVFEQLSVFAGGCSLAEAERVGEQLGLGPFELLDMLGGLADKSLLAATAGADGQPRYGMLETLRTYGIQRLRDRGQYDPARRRHAELFAAIAETGEQALYGPEHLTWLRRIEDELENLRAAVHNAIAIGEAGVAVRVAGALGFFFATTERHAMGRGWLETALDAADDAVPPLARARALSYLGYLEGQQGDFDTGIHHAELGLSLVKASGGDTWQMAGSRLILALTLGEAGHYERVPALLAQAKAGYDAIADPRADWGVAACQLIAAEAAVLANDLEAAERANREALACSRRIGYDMFEAWARLLSGWIAEQHGDLAAATAECQAAVEVSRRLGLSHHVAFALALLGRLAMRSGNLDRALALQTEAADIVDATVSPWFASFVHHGLALTMQRLGRADAESLFRQATAESPAAGPQFSALFYKVIGGSPAARSLIALGATALSRGDLADAERLQAEGLRRAVREADTTAIGLGLEGIAATAAAAGEAERAATLLGAAESVRTAVGESRDRLIEQALATVQRA